MPSPIGSERVNYIMESVKGDKISVSHISFNHKWEKYDEEKDYTEEELKDVDNIKLSCNGQKFLFSEDTSVFIEDSLTINEYEFSNVNDNSNTISFKPIGIFKESLRFVKFSDLINNELTLYKSNKRKLYY